MLSTNLNFDFALIVLSAQIVIFYLKIGWRMMVHPGTFFALIWLFSVFSQQVLMNFEFALIRDLKSINELNVFVGFTSLFFIFWVLVTKQNSRNHLVFNLVLNTHRYKNIVLITLIGSVTLMIYTWFTIGVNSINLAEIRDLNTNDKTNYFGTEANIFVSLMKYTQFFYPLISILSGYFLSKTYLLNRPLDFDKKYLIIPILISVVYVFSSGGRNPIFDGIKYYFVGSCFAFPMSLSFQKKKWLFTRVAIVVTALAFFTTFVNDARREYSKEKLYSQNFNSPILSALSGGIEYAGAHYYGYQLRNKDTYDPNALGYGFYTFNSVFNLGLPLAKYHGINGSLGNLIGFDHNPIDYFYLWENHYEGYYTTNSVYLGLKLDFGFYGTILFLFLFTFYTNWLFVKIQNGKKLTVFTILWFSMCFEFWASSNFKSPYSVLLVQGIIMTIIFSKIAVKKQLKVRF
jgi:oligosaccharide repeat unit polymerase